MTTGQFNFSFSVGIALVALGGVMLGKSTIGFSLMALGAGIAALAILTRGARGKHNQAVLSPEPLRHFQDPTPDYRAHD